MKIPVKLLKTAGGLIIALLVLLFAASAITQDKVADIVLKSLNRNFSTKIETGSYHLSFIKKFPKASFELKNVLIHSSSDFDREAFKGINTDTLLTAKSASIDFKIIDMLKGVYTFKKITLKSGILNLYTDTSGRYNYNVSGIEKNKTANKNVILNLDRINMSEIRFLYNDLRVNLIINGIFDEGRIKSRIEGNTIDFNGNSKVTFESFRLGKALYKHNVKAHLEVGLTRNEKGFFFRKSTLSIEKQDFTLTGFIAADNFLDLDISGVSIDISKIPHYIPDRYKNITSEYLPEGNLKINCKIKGKASHILNPHYEISGVLKDAGIRHSRSGLSISRLSFDASYNNGKSNKPATSTLVIRNFNSRLGSADYKGSFSVTDFTRPDAELTFRGPIIIAELKEFLNLENVSAAEGSIDLNIKMSGLLGKKDHYTAADLSDMKSQSEADFKSFGIVLKNRNFALTNTTGRVLVAEKTSTENLSFILNEQIFELSGSLANFTQWLAGKPVSLNGSVSLASPCLKPELFLKDPSGKKETEPARAPLVLPEDLFIDLNFSIDTINYKTFDARKIRGQLSFKPKMVNFKTIKFYSQSGDVSGNGLVVQNRDKSFVGRGSFVVNNVDVNQSFKSFNNFGQNFLKAENIAGSLSGTLTLILPVDSMLNPVMKSLTAEGKYRLTNGALRNFEPVKALSGFIELSELENIKFDQMDNDFFIRNNYFYLPQMDIKSSAVDLSVNGLHSFDNDYQYHVRMLLSEILSNKARRRSDASGDFGEVKDDGLGRTLLFLKIEGKGGDVDVSYDMKAAGKKIKDDIRNEKQNLKNILNEEYGLYSVPAEQPKEQASKPRFRISWEGSETRNQETEPKAEKKEGVLKKIFRKK
jgi:hypothetical protein